MDAQPEEIVPPQQADAQCIHRIGQGQNVRERPDPEGHREDGYEHAAEEDHREAKVVAQGHRLEDLLDAHRDERA